ncbi:MAG: ATP-binding protein [Cyanophyceae cyanobacterium]
MNPLVVSGTLESLRAIAQYVKAAAQEAGLEPKKAYQLRLAVDEIATNVVMHSYQGATGNITCQAFLTEETLTIVLEDTGAPFDPTQYVPDTLDQPLEQRAIGGLGIYLATQNLDRLEYQRVSQRNRNLLVKALGDGEIVPTGRGKGKLSLRDGERGNCLCETGKGETVISDQAN